MSNNFFCSSAIWLPHGQLWATHKWTASPTPCSSMHFNFFDPKIIESLVTRTLSPAECLMALEPEPSSSNQNALTYYIFAREVLILEKSCPKKVLNS